MNGTSQPVTRPSASSLQLLRHAQRLSQAELAASAGVTRETISNLEGGRRAPRLETAQALARVFGDPVDVLFPHLNDDDPAATGSSVTTTAGHGHDGDGS